MKFSQLFQQYFNNTNYILKSQAQNLLELLSVVTPPAALGGFQRQIAICEMDLQCGVRQASSLFFYSNCVYVSIALCRWCSVFVWTVCFYFEIEFLLGLGCEPQFD